MKDTKTLTSILPDIMTPLHAEELAPIDGHQHKHKHHNHAHSIHSQVTPSMQSNKSLRRNSNPNVVIDLESNTLTTTNTTNTNTLNTNSNIDDNNTHNPLTTHIIDEQPLNKTQTTHMIGLPNLPLTPTDIFQTQFYVTTTTSTQLTTELNNNTAHISPNFVTQITAGRPNIGQIFDQTTLFCLEHNIHRVAVYVCGPESMLNEAADLSAKSQKWCCGSKNVRFECHTEVYNL